MLQLRVKSRFRDIVKPCFSLAMMEPVRKTEDLATMGGRLKSALMTAKMRQRTIADHFEVTEQAVSQWFRNETTPDMARIFELARLLGVRAEWLLHGTLPRDGAPPAEAAPKPAETTDLNIRALPLDLPVRGNAACGEDGLFELNGEVLDHVRRPPRLMNVKDAYALWLGGESMAPWREHGGLVVVHPHQPVRINDYVVVQLKAKDGDPIPAYVKRLVKRTSTQLVLLQFNPRKEITIPLSKVRAVHRILDWDEAMGI